MSEKLWNLQPHTRTKHLILKVYLQAWLPIMSTQYGQILIIDGFAGRGRYSGGEEGSPLIALRTLIEHPRFNNPARQRKVLLLFIEKRRGNFQALREELTNFAQQNTIPPWIVYDVKHGGVVEHVDELMNKLESHGVGLPPTFAFIDPHGYRIPLKTLARILKFPRGECLINFMYKFINRATHRREPEIQQYLNDLFGTSEWRDIKTISEPESRQAFLVGLYKRQIQSVVGLRHVRTFQMIDSGNRTEYFLFFGTNNASGLSEMKRAMWKADPRGGQMFSDRTDPDHGQLVLIEPKPELSGLRRTLQDRFRGQGPVDIHAIEQFVLFNTPYSEKVHLRTSTLKIMEQDNLLRITRPPGARNAIGKYPNGTKITFL